MSHASQPLQAAASSMSEALPHMDMGAPSWRQVVGSSLPTRDRVALVTGASCGLGRAIAEHLAGAGWRVFAVSRSIDAWARGAALPERILPLVMDVTNDRSVDDALARIAAETSHLDLVVNNAGFGVAGAVEETPEVAARAQLETNFFGTARVCRAVLPHMRRRRGGTIVNVSSIGGRLGLPFQGYYSASKFAVEGLSEALRFEMAPFGVRICLLEPGNFKTNFGAHRQRVGLADASPYAEPCRRAVNGMAADEAAGADPVKAARAVVRLAESRHPPLRTTVGPWLERLGLCLSQWVPRSLFERVYKNVMHL